MAQPETATHKMVFRPARLCYKWFRATRHRERRLGEDGLTNNLLSLHPQRNCDDADRAARIIQMLGIKSDDVVNYRFPKEWPADREQRARYIGEWLKTEARFLAS